MYVLGAKLRVLKSCIKVWNKSVFRYVNMNVDRAFDALAKRKFPAWVLQKKGLQRRIMLLYECKRLLLHRKIFTVTSLTLNGFLKGIIIPFFSIP
ncbi:hypothetical protein FF1_008749 [Malus domestica]